MSSWLNRIVSSWLGRPSDPAAVSDAELDAELAALEREAARALPGSSGQVLNRAGDLCHGAGRTDRALRYYGRAIDAYLEAGRYDAAGAVCRKVVRIAPSVVRARCTLAWLSIGKGLLRDARRDLKEYVAAAREAGQEAVAREQLHLMAEAARGPELRELIVTLLRELGDAEGAERLAGEGVEPADPDGGVDPEAHWARVLRAALMGPKELLDRQASESR